MLVSALGHIGVSAAVTEASWPRFRGARGDGISADAGLLPQWPETGPKLAWTASGLGHGFGSVAQEGGLVCVAGDSAKSCVVTAMDLAGTTRWQVENGAAWQGSVPGGRGTPTIDRGRVYHENAFGVVVSLDAKTGQAAWTRKLTEEFGGRYSAWGYAESLVVDGEHVICCPGGDTAMAALDRDSGQTVWKSASAGEPAGYATPILAEYQGLRLLLTMSERSLLGVNADTGELLWRFEHYTPRYVANCVSPIYHGGRILVSGGYGKGCVLLKLNVEGKTVGVEPVWRTGDLDNRHGGIILFNGSVYGASQTTNKGQWVCLDWETGVRRYAEPGVGEGSVALAEGMLYTLSERARVGLVKATPTGHQVISQFSLPAGGRDATWAHPVVVGGRLYIRHGDRLYAYDVRAN
jgi:outer membrane protein assembly factor BamB